MTDDELAVIEARAEAAGAGTWGLEKTRDGFGGTLYHLISTPADGSRTVHLIGHGNYGENGGIHSRDTAEFILHSREDVLALVAALRVARDIDPT